MILAVIKNKTSATESSKVLHIRLLTFVKLVWSFLQQRSDESSVGNIACCVYCLSSKVFRQSIFTQHTSCHFNKCFVLPLNNTILLRCSWCWELMGNTIVFTKIFELWILKFFAMITSNLTNLSILLFLYSFAKLDKLLKNFILGSEKVYPSVARIVIHDDISIVFTT